MNRKSNAAFAQLHNSQFNEDEEEEETANTPKTQIKCRKRSMLDEREEDPKVILCSEERSSVYRSAGMQNPLTALEHKAVSIALQKSIVPWLIAILGID